MSAYAYRAPSGDGQQADLLSEAMEGATSSQRLAFEEAESSSNRDAITACVLTVAFVMMWLLLDQVVELAHSIFFGAMK